MGSNRTIAAAAAALAVAAGGISGAPAQADGHEITVGFIGSFDSDAGRSALRGTEIAIDEINAAGGVLGKQVRLVFADTREDVTEGIKA